MPLVDAKPDAVARVYAESLLALAKDAGGRDKAEEIVGELSDILEIARLDPSFSEFLASRVVPSKARDAAIERIFEGRASDLTVRFLRVLNDKNRLSHLPAITTALDELVQAEFGRVEVDIFTAAPIDAGELESIRTRLTQVIGKEVVAHPYTDPAMLGGVRFRVGDVLVDGSLESQLRTMRDRLSGSGMDAFRAASGDLIEREPEQDTGQDHA